jgi:hypothetical protein
MCPRRSALPIASGVFCLVLASCSSRPASEEPLGEAFVGPITLNLRSDISGRSSTVAALRHGDRLDVLEMRRRFVRVRSKEGVEGWTDANLLLDSQQMQKLESLAQHASQLPSQGGATVFDTLNVHAEPSRQSPSFYQIPEGETVEVVGHRVAPRIQKRPVTRIAKNSEPPPLPRKKKSKGVQTAAPLVPVSPPFPPEEWVQMSRPRASDLPGYVAPESVPIPLDDWSLVRTPNGTAGWVLSRMLYMAIPDEVAQYAEGHRITAYLPLGEVRDGEIVKKNWLWTTAAPGVRPSEFDSFRVFVWSIKRHRYETAYLERNVVGYYPVELVPVPGGQDKGFSVIVEDKDGKLYKKTYGFNGYRIRMLSKAPYERRDDHPQQQYTSSSEGAPAQPGQGWWNRINGLARQWFRR